MVYKNKHSEYVAMRERERYHSDPEYRKKKIEASKARAVSKRVELQHLKEQVEAMKKIVGD